MPTEYTPRASAAIAQTAAATTVVVAAPGAGRQIVVNGYVLVAAGDCTVKFVSGATDLTGAMALTVNGGIANKGVRLVCGVNEALSLVTVTGYVTGHLEYSIE